MGTAIGCPSQPGTALEDADQSAIEAYQAEQAKEQAAMDDSLDTKP
ncbi:signal peptide protein [Rhodopirellula europaea 6C]|uniref:Signal peptide protein n=1 Tax=Rhodopirellula europaea 6C TaxID=1263867 RepID=M2A4B7_9BACT|nr:signal peptide protein [Rhodopirellula europaea 6C]